MDRWLNAITRARASQRLHPFQLLISEDSSVLESLALRCVQSLFCEGNSRPTGPACGVCRSCVSVQNLSHPGWVRLEEGAKLDTVRQAVKAASLAPWHGMQVLYFPMAQMLGPESVNLLLKTLEEPPRGCLILMTAPSKKALAATLVSRAQVHHIWSHATVRSGSLSGEGENATDESTPTDKFPWLGQIFEDQKLPEDFSARDPDDVRELERAILLRLREGAKFWRTEEFEERMSLYQLGLTSLKQFGDAELALHHIRKAVSLR